MVQIGNEPKLECRKLGNDVKTGIKSKGENHQDATKSSSSSSKQIHQSLVFSDIRYRRIFLGGGQFINND